MRRVLDALAWVFVGAAIAAAFYLSSAKIEISSGVADHKHVSEAQRAGCQSCPTDGDIEAVDVAGPIRAVRAF
jgi:hypothetical protein